MNFKETIARTIPEPLCLQKLTILQVNLSNRCNQSCRHCHLNAGPTGENFMARAKIDRIIAFLKKHPELILDITGGAPEMHPDFKYLIEKTDHVISQRIVRTNLTIITEKNMAWLPEFYKDHNIILAASLPCYTRENVDRQRGKGTFDKSIKALRKLNEIGYGRTLELNLVYNPIGPSLPASQNELKLQFRQQLSQNYGIRFNNLFTIANTPIGRFEKMLRADSGYEQYINLLSENFNPRPAADIMCRKLINVDWQGILYNCDFNQAQNLPITDSKGRIMTVDCLEDIISAPPEIITGTHCFACTAGAGSSCYGELNTGRPDKRREVKEYYGRILKSKHDLKTGACCTAESVPAYHRKITNMIHSEILDKFYGCGSPIPLCLEKCVVLDLGCGTGRDSFIAAYLTGEQGYVIGVDMTEEQLKVGRRHIKSQMKTFGFSEINVDLRHGNIENLRDSDIDDNSIDVVISNCVINLSPDKPSVFSEIFRVLKPGGELYFSDIFAGRRIPSHISSDPAIYGECLGGAIYIEDFRRMLHNLGCPDYRVVSKRRISLNDPEVKKKAGMIDFYAMAIRTFKLNDLEDRCEDYGQTAVYLGTIPESLSGFMLDDHHLFRRGKPVSVCGNTAAMLSRTRYKKHFKITGNTDTHLGPFACNPDADNPPTRSGGSCC